MAEPMLAHDGILGTLPTYVERAVTGDKLQTPTTNEEPEEHEESQGPNGRRRYTTCQSRDKYHEYARSQNIRYCLHEGWPTVNEQQRATDVRR